MNKKLLLIVSILLVLSMTLAGCGSKTVEPAAPAAPAEPAQAAEEPAPAEPETPAEEPAEVSEPEPAEEEPATIEVVDQAGRTVTIPNHPTKIMGYNAMGQGFLYALAPDKLMSLGSKPSEGEAYFYPDYVNNLPVLGDNSGKRSMNPEEVIKAAPDFILHMADLHDGNLETVEEMQAQLNIPIVIIDSDMNKMDETFRFVGALIGAEEQAEKLAAYTRSVIDDINAKAASIPEDQRVSVYYAEGEDGLQTDPEGSDHSRAFTAVNAKNAAEIEDFDAYYGRVTVSMEQIMEWDPEYVVFCPDDSIFAEGVASICQDLMDGKEVGSWNSLNAVKNNKFFEAPYGLANAIDRPATINLVYGYQWVGNLLYPEVFDYDMNKVTKEFYSLFYHYDMNDEEVAKLLSRASER